MGFFAGDADVFGRRLSVARKIVPDLGNFTALLRRVELISETTLSAAVRGLRDHLEHTGRTLIAVELNIS